MTCGTVQQGLTSLSGRVFALVDNNGTARREGHAFQQLTTSGYQLTGQPFILLQVHLRATVSSDNLHLPPLLPGHHDQFSHPLTLPGCTALPGHNGQRRTVLCQNTDRIAVTSRPGTLSPDVWSPGSVS